jgi:hypothetical protein
MTQTAIGPVAKTWALRASGGKHGRKEDNCLARKIQTALHFYLHFFYDSPTTSHIPMYIFALALTHAWVYLAPRYGTVGDADDDAALAIAGSRGPTALSDGSGMASCGGSTQGIDADTGDCSCGTSSDTTTFSLAVLVRVTVTQALCLRCEPLSYCLSNARMWVHKMSLLFTKTRARVERFQCMSHFPHIFPPSSRWKPTALAIPWATSRA